MPRKPRNRLAENIGDFAGPDADLENIEKLAKAAEEANKKIGHNGGQPPAEVIRRNYDALKVCLLEIEAAQRIVQKARAAFGVARKTAKTDLGSKSWVDSVVEAVNDDRACEKAGTGPLVTETRQKAAVFKAVGSPLYTQLGFNFADEEATAPKSDEDLINEATLAGEHAGLNGEPIGNCPYQAGTPQAFGWRNGHQIGADKLTDSFKTGRSPEAVAAH